jgi:hypothetical protein
MNKSSVDRRGSPLYKAAKLVHDTFIQDVAQGYQSKDRQFAIEILGAALYPATPLNTEASSSLSSSSLRTLVEQEKEKGHTRMDKQASSTGAATASANEKAARVHELKTWPEYYDHLVDGSKTFEFRLNDRGFKVGDVLHLREWEQPLARYTGREMYRRVTYMLNTSPEFVVMALGEGAAMDARFTPTDQGKATGSASNLSSTSMPSGRSPR